MKFNMDAKVIKTLQAISSMTQTEGWQYLKQDFSLLIERLQKEINEPGGNELKYSEGDLLKIRLRILSDILDYPDKFTSMAQTGTEVEELDPYNSN
jgi:hypothetical protein